MEIFPSLISSDILNLEKTIKELDSHCAGYHIDIMDDHFVPSLTWGSMFVTAIGSLTDLPLHVHLMVDNPDSWIDRLILDEDDIFIFHAEIFDIAQLAIDLIEKVKSKKKCKVGVAVNPKTKISFIDDYLKHLDHVLIMSVEPGFSGQKFMPEVVSKVELLKNKREELKLNFTIGMDGGIGFENIKNLVENGVDQFGIASAIFSKPNPLNALEELNKI